MTRHRRRSQVKTKAEDRPKPVQTPDSDTPQCLHHRPIFARTGRGGYRHDPNDSNLLSHFPCWMRAYRLHKYTKLLKHMSYRQLKQLDFGQLEQLGIEGVGPRNKLLRLLDEVDVHNLDEGLTPESDTPPSEQRSPSAASVAPALIAQGRSTPETDQGIPPARGFDTAGAATIEAATSNESQAPPKLPDGGTLQPVAVTMREAATISEDSTASPAVVQPTSATHPPHTQEENNPSAGQSSSGPSTLGFGTTSSFKLQPTVPEFTPTTTTTNRPSRRYDTLDHFYNKFFPSDPHTRLVWNGWFWQQEPSRNLVPPPNPRPESFLPMGYPEPTRTGTRGPAPVADADGQPGSSSTLLQEEEEEEEEEEETSASGSGNQGHQEETMGSVVIGDDARDPGLPEGMRDLATRLIRMVDELTAGR